MDDTLKDATLGKSPLGDFPEIAKMYAINPKAAQAETRMAGAKYNDDVTVANQKAAQAAKQKELEALANPNNYQQVPKADGGYSFLSPNGKEISAYEYSRITGKSLDSILSQSQNPIDVGFNEDYKNLDEYIKAKIGSKTNKDDLATAQQIERIVKEQYGIELNKMDIRQVYERFQQAYPTVFGMRNTGVRAGTTLLPRAGF